MKPYAEKNCVRCGHTWGSSSKNPCRCPACGTYNWNKPPVVHSCLRCGHTWTAKRDWPPKRCPSCRSSSWNREQDDPAGAPAVRPRPAASKADEATVRMILKAYREGGTCTGIAMRTAVPFSIVHAVIRENHPGADIRI